MAALIREICQHKGIPLKALAIVLSHGDGFLSQLELPELPEKEWKDAVLWEALQYVPYEEGTFGPVLEVMGKKDRLFPPSSPRRLLWNWSFLNVLQTCFPAAW